MQLALRTLGPRDAAESIVRGQRPRTARARNSALNSFGTWLGKDRLGGVGHLLAMSRPDAHHLVRQWKDDLKQKGKHPRTINAFLGTLTRLVAQAQEYNLIPHWTPATLSVEGYSVRNERNTEGISAKQFTSLINSLTGNSAEARRDLAIIRLLWDRAMRRFEVCSLNVEDLDLQAGEFKFIGKARDDAEAWSLPSETLAAISRWLEVRGTEPGPLFWGLDNRSISRRSKGIVDRLDGGTIWRMVKRRCIPLGILDARPHKFRHGVCNHLIDAGVEITKVSDYMRHENLNTTMLYKRRRRQTADSVAEIAAKA